MTRLLARIRILPAEADSNLDEEVILQLKSNIPESTNLRHMRRNL